MRRSGKENGQIIAGQDTTNWWRKLFRRSPDKDIQVGKSTEEICAEKFISICHSLLDTKQWLDESIVGHDTSIFDLFNITDLEERKYLTHMLALNLRNYFIEPPYLIDGRKISVCPDLSRVLKSTFITDPQVPEDSPLKMSGGKTPLDIAARNISIVLLKERSATNDIYVFLVRDPRETVSFNLINRLSKDRTEELVQASMNYQHTVRRLSS